MRAYPGSMAAARSRIPDARSQINGWCGCLASIEESRGSERLRGPPERRGGGQPRRSKRWACLSSEQEGDVPRRGAEELPPGAHHRHHQTRRLATPVCCCREGRGARRGLRSLRRRSSGSAPGEEGHRRIWTPPALQSRDLAAAPITGSSRRS
jgi:hypothetical protein